MLSLEAIRLDSQLRCVPRRSIIIVGSVTLALFKEMAGIEKAERYLRIDDLDLCVDEKLYAKLYRNSKPKSEILTSDNCWAQNRYRNVQTLRREHTVSKLKRPVQLDVGRNVFTWSHSAVQSDALEFDGYSVLNPFHQLAWYEVLGRKKDDVKIKMLRELIIPIFADRPDLTLPVPFELQDLAQGVLGRAA
ncbi:hypothetical protein IPL68_00845 [Candidatus Saccharibacteria bacterium]|nr:MAG: hypothetical protein IPL68_00845 [Candidatus Saccharibacteria bacterium]